MKKKDNISIKDVAQRAGVSPTTVSRVINDSKHPVNENTKKLVREAIDELNYQPNRLAQGLKKNKSKIIGVIVHDISDEYFAQMVRGIETVTFDNDYIVNIINTERDIHKELKAVEMLKANRAEAIIFTGGNLIDNYYNQKMKKNIKELKNQGCYIVGVTSHPFDIKNIEIGNKEAAESITKHLIDKGHQQIAYVNGPEILNTTRERYRGYKKAFKETDIELKGELVVDGDFTFEGGRQAAKDLLKFKDQITAIVASNDETALGVMWQLKQEGIQIPEDISVTGIGNIPASNYSHPPLTTISLPLYDLGQQLGDYLINYLKDSHKEISDVEVEIGLVERSSVDSLNKSD